MLKALPLLEAYDGGPLRDDASLPLHVILHPMGYAVEIVTNSHAVLQAATKLWRRYPALSDAAPIRIRVLVSAADAASLRQRVPPRVDGQLFSIVHGVQDFAVADLSERDWPSRICHRPQSQRFPTSAITFSNHSHTSCRGRGTSFTCTPPVFRGTAVRWCCAASQGPARLASRTPAQNVDGILSPGMLCTSSGQGGIAW